MKSILLLFLSLLPILSYAFQADSLNNFTYTINIPQDWTTKEGCNASDCSYLAPQDNGQDTFLENINITVVEAPAKNYAVKKYTDFSLGYLPTVMDNFELIDRKALPNNAEYIIYKGFKSNYNQTWKQYYFIKGNTLYILTFTAETPKFEEYIAKIQENLDSFKMK
jgi:hypothetical protein